MALSQKKHIPQNLEKISLESCSQSRGLITCRDMCFCGTFDKKTIVLTPKPQYTIYPIFYALKKKRNCPCYKRHLSEIMTNHKQ